MTNKIPTPEVLKLIGNAMALTVSVAASGKAHPFFWFSGHTLLVEFQCVKADTDYRNRNKLHDTIFPSASLRLNEDGDIIVQHTISAYCDCLQKILDEYEASMSAAA